MCIAAAVLQHAASSAGRIQKHPSSTHVLYTPYITKAELQFTVIQSAQAVNHEFGLEATAGVGEVPLHVSC